MILSTVKQFCGAVELKKYFINPDEVTSYPLQVVDNLFKYSIDRLAKVIKEQNDFIKVKVGEHFKCTEIDTLLKFEPYACLSEELIMILIDENNKNLEISSDLISAWMGKNCTSKS